MSLTHKAKSFIVCCICIGFLSLSSSKRIGKINTETFRLTWLFLSNIKDYKLRFQNCHLHTYILFFHNESETVVHLNILLTTMISLWGTPTQYWIFLIWIFWTPKQYFEALSFNIESGSGKTGGLSILNLDQEKTGGSINIITGLLDSADSTSGLLVMKGSSRVELSTVQQQIDMDSGKIIISTILVIHDD